MIARLSLRGYARHRGCTPAAVVKALQTERLTPASVRRVRGRWQIDSVAADREWQANTLPAAEPLAAPALAEDHPAGALFAAVDGLVVLSATIEGRLSRCFRELVQRDPEAPAVAWEALYRE
jgi:hypothetical protein